MFPRSMPQGAGGPLTFTLCFDLPGLVLLRISSVSDGGSARLINKCSPCCCFVIPLTLTFPLPYSALVGRTQVQTNLYAISHAPRLAIPWSSLPYHSLFAAARNSLDIRDRAFLTLGSSLLLTAFSLTAIPHETLIFERTSQSWVQEHSLNHLSWSHYSSAELG